MCQCGEICFGKYVLVVFLPKRNNSSSVHKVSGYMRKGNADSVSPYVWKKQLSRQSPIMCEFTGDDRCPTVFLQLMLIIIKVFIKHKILSIETKCEHAHTEAPTHLSILATQN